MNNFLLTVTLAAIFQLCLALKLPMILEDTLPFLEVGEADRIVGGVEASAGEFPYIVSIQIAKNIQDPNTVYLHACGGSILNSEYIVTAGHCSTFATERYKIVAGAYDLFHPSGDEQVRRALRVITHKFYNPQIVDYDVAVIQVTPPFEFNERVKTIKLPSGGNVFTGFAETAGWGLLHTEDKDTPAVLQKINLPLIPDVQCYEIYEGINLVITDRMLCAGYDEGESVCNGDSGGPLVSSSIGGESVLFGLVSWGMPCAIQGYPAVFTKVDSVLNFLQEYVPIS